MKSSQLIKQFGALALAGALGAFLAGCSAGGDSISQQVAKDRLEQARANYALAKDSQMVDSYAVKHLLDAEKTLKEAELASKKANAPPINPALIFSQAEQDALHDDVARLAYVSSRKSEGAVSYAEGMVAGNDKLRLGKEKAEVQLQKSSIEKRRLQRDVEEMNSALERSRQELSLASSEAEKARIMADIQAKEALLAKVQAAAKDKETEEALALAAANADDAEMARLELALLLKELSELQGQLTDRGIVLTVGDVLFATAKADLNASAQGSMVKIGAFLNKNLTRNLLIEGHTDSVGGDEYNQGLSEQRAASVKDALVGLGIASERIVTIGYGKRFPVSGIESKTGRQQDRRVDVIILNAGVKPESQFRK